MNKLQHKIILLFFVMLITTNLICETKKVSNSLGGITNDPNLKNAPTIINSKSLEVNSQQRIFYYKESVIVRQADMTLTCDELEGHYDQNNQIEKLIAKKNVVIVKGDKIKATSQRAVYSAKDQIITMTNNPQLEQNGSLLSADVVKVFVAEDRSTAEGNVEVTLVNQPTVATTPTFTPVPGTTPVPIITHTATPTPVSIPGVSVLSN
jgi:lipopolysaccharide transport protein LptA